MNLWESMGIVWLHGVLKLSQAIHPLLQSWTPPLYAREPVCHFTNDSFVQKHDCNSAWLSVPLTSAQEGTRTSDFHIWTPMNWINHFIISINSHHCLSQRVFCSCTNILLHKMWLQLHHPADLPAFSRIVLHLQSTSQTRPSPLAELWSIPRVCHHCLSQCLPSCYVDICRAWSQLRFHFKFPYDNIHCQPMLIATHRHEFVKPVSSW